jgi:hypothetical protein
MWKPTKIETDENNTGKKTTGHRIRFIPGAIVFIYFPTFVDGGGVAVTFAQHGWKTVKRRVRSKFLEKELTFASTEKVETYL